MDGPSSPHLLPSRRQLSGLRATHHARSEPSAPRSINHASRAESQGDRGKCQNRPAGRELPPRSSLWPGRTGWGEALPGGRLARAACSGPSLWPWSPGPRRRPSPHRAHLPELPLTHRALLAIILSPNIQAALLLWAHQRESEEMAHPGSPGGFMVIGNHTQFWNLPPPTATPPPPLLALELSSWAFSPPEGCLLGDSHTNHCQRPVHPAPGSHTARPPAPECRPLPLRLVLRSLSPHTSRSCPTDGEAEAAAGAQALPGLTPVWAPGLRLLTQEAGAMPAL